MNVYSQRKHVAMVRKQPPIADGYNSVEPWMLLHNSGRTDRFATYKDARAEAIKSYPAVRFSRK